MDEEAFTGIQGEVMSVAKENLIEELSDNRVIYGVDLEEQVVKAFAILPCGEAY